MKGATNGCDRLWYSVVSDINFSLKMILSRARLFGTALNGSEMGSCSDDIESARGARADTCAWNNKARCQFLRALRLIYLDSIDLTMVSANKSSINPRRFIHSSGQALADQYYHIYNARLKCAREALIRSAKFRWGDEVNNVPLEQLNASLGSKDVFVIGTIFKSMPKQPSILREIEGNDSLTRESETADVNFTTPEDTLVLHETDENVQVVGDIDADQHVTGIPVALLGHQLNDGAKFHVVDVCYAGPSLDVYRDEGGDRFVDQPSSYLVIVSGFEFGFDSKLSKEETLKVINGLKKFRDFIHKQSDDLSEYKNLTKVIVAGNSIGPGYTKAQMDLLGPTEDKDIGSLNRVVQLFDRYLNDLAQAGVDITLMPGKNDPTSFLLPQQPFHPKLLPLSGRLESIHPDTNPSLMELDGRIILGTSGENIEAIKQHSKIEYSTTILKNTLEWGHVAPSAPDNLSCLPFKDEDPFIIDFVPDVYFAGNQPEFTVTTYSCSSKPKVQLVSVPSFVKTQSCVLIDLKNLDCELINF